MLSIIFQISLEAIKHDLASIASVALHDAVVVQVKDFAGVLHPKPPLRNGL